MSNDKLISNVKPHWSFWCISGVAVLWNAMGALDYFMTQTKNSTWMANFPVEQLEYFYSIPSWVDATWAIGVWGGLVGSILMLFKSRFAVGVFVLSLLGAIVTSIYNYALSNGLDIMGSGAALFSGAIIFIALMLCLYSKRMRLKGVLR